MTVERLNRGLDSLIARILIGKPDLTPSLLRLIVPNLQQYDDHALAQKIAYLRKKNPRRRELQ